MRLPPLPTRVEGAAGPIKVVRVKGPIVHDDADCWALWDSATRTIRIDRKANPRHRWELYFHELTHAALFDSGVKHKLNDGTHEAVCDAVATAMMRERFG